MADFHARDAFASQNGAVINTAATNASPWKNTHHGASSLGGAETILAIYSGIDVIQNFHMALKLVFQNLAEWNVLPAQIHGFANQSLLQIDRTGTTDANPAELLGRNLRFIQHG